LDKFDLKFSTTPVEITARVFDTEVIAFGDVEAFFELFLLITFWNGVRKSFPIVVHAEQDIQNQG
jgi:hypothetical protein